MQTILLNDQPVQRGTRLSYLDTSDFPMAPEYVTVTSVDSAFVRYEGEGVEGEHRSSDLGRTFKHYEE